jgi:hypothetical protein
MEDKVKMAANLLHKVVKGRLAIDRFKNESTEQKSILQSLL